MKLINIINSYDSLVKLAEFDLPIYISFNISDIIYEIEKHINNYNEKKNKLLIKYGTTINKIDYDIKAENIEVFRKELEALHNIDINLNINKIVLPSDIKISAKILYALKDFIERGDIIDGN